MSPDELARLHPRLYHITALGNGPSILARGFYATRDLVAHLPQLESDILITKRRPIAVQIAHPVHGRVVINDNAPIHEGKLARCLDDGLTTAEWLDMLNSRVFFFTRAERRERLRNARAVRGTARDHIVVDTLRLAQSYGEVMEISPINSGNTNHRPARRGRATFAPLLQTDYNAWRRRRPKATPDTIAEVVVRGSIPDIAAFVVDHIHGETTQ